MTAEDALKQLGSSTAEAVAKTLAMFAPDGLEQGGVTIVPQGQSSLASFPFPAVAASVSYVDGVSGGNFFFMTRAGARKLAAAMMGMDPTDVGDAELSELEVSAVAEAANQMMAAAAGATSTTLGEEMLISPPMSKVLMTTQEGDEFLDESPYVTSAAFSVLGEPCRLVQLVPAAFVMRMTRALESLEGDAVEETLVEAADVGSPAAAESIRLVPVRLSVELGRTRMPIGDAVRLWQGAVVELEPSVEEPLEVLVNGYRFAVGRLVLVDGTDWAIRIERVIAEPAAQEAAIQGGVT
jgi:flagellar motor switch protein FliN/FliY